MSGDSVNHVVNDVDGIIFARACFAQLWLRQRKLTASASDFGESTFDFIFRERIDGRIDTSHTFQREVCAASVLTHPRNIPATPTHHEQQTPTIASDTDNATGHDHLI